MPKFEGSNSVENQAPDIDKKLELIDKKIATLEGMVDTIEDETKKLELMDKLEAEYEKKAKLQVQTEAGREELQETVQEAAEELKSEAKAEVKEGKKLNKLKMQIGAGVLALIAATGIGMSIGGGEKSTDTSGGEKVENVEQEVSEKQLKEIKKINNTFRESMAWRGLSSLEDADTEEKVDQAYRESREVVQEYNQYLAMYDLDYLQSIGEKAKEMDAMGLDYSEVLRNQTIKGDSQSVYAEDAFNYANVAALKVFGPDSYQKEYDSLMEDFDSAAKDMKDVLGNYDKERAGL